MPSIAMMQSTATILYTSQTTDPSTFYAFYVFYVWWIYFLQSGALTEGVEEASHVCIAAVEQPCQEKLAAFTSTHLRACH
jgi:hypothetical protein